MRATVQTPSPLANTGSLAQDGNMTVLDSKTDISTDVSSDDRAHSATSTPPAVSLAAKDLSVISRTSATPDHSSHSSCKSSNQSGVVENSLRAADVQKVTHDAGKQRVSNAGEKTAGGHAGAKPGGPGGSGGPPGFGGPPIVYPTGIRLYSNIISLYLAGFLTALDRTVVVNAIPTITTQFDSTKDVGWYGSSYLLTFCAFQLLFGKIYSFYNAKWVFLSAVLIFLIGSAICGAAQSSVMLIVGRAVAGLGSSGIFGGSVIITFFTVPLKLRPIYSGIVSCVFALASIIGPLIGGALTQHASWRWCFYINLPVGAVTILVTLVVLKLPPAKKAGTPWKDQILAMDPLGNLCFIPAIICLILALEWGGTEYAWSNGRIIALFVVFGVLISAFVLLQIKLQEKATVPPRILKQRSLAAAVIYTAMVTGSMMTLTYYLPIWFQAIKDASPTRSGIMMLAMVVPSAATALGSGIVISRWVGYYSPFMLACTALMAVGAGMLTTFTPTSGPGEWIGYQFLWSFGAGLGLQAGGLVAQTVSARMDAPISISMVFFAQSLGGSIFLAIDQSVFDAVVKTQLRQIAGVNVDEVYNGGAAAIRSSVTASQLPEVVAAYSYAVTRTFLVAAATAALGFVAALAIEWKSVKKEKDQLAKPSGPPTGGGAGGSVPGGPTTGTGMEKV